VLLGAGVSPEVAAKIMGHKNVTDLYADLLRQASQNQTAARQVEAFLEAKH